MDESKFEINYVVIKKKNERKLDFKKQIKYKIKNQIKKLNCCKKSEHLNMSTTTHCSELTNNVLTLKNATILFLNLNRMLHHETKIM